MKRTISEDAAALAGGGDPAGGVPEAAGRPPLRALMDDSLLDELLARSRDEAGGLRLTGEGSMLGELIRAVLERALEAELTAHLGYAKGGRGGAGTATPATGRSPRRSRRASGRCRFRSRGTGRDRSSRCWCPSGRDGSRAAWTT